MWQCHVSSSECRCYRLNGFSLLKRFPLSADGACGKALDQPVGEWLEHVGLPQYESKFLLNGFDDLRFMVSHLQHVFTRVARNLHHLRQPMLHLSFHGAPSSHSSSILFFCANHPYPHFKIYASAPRMTMQRFIHPC